MATSIGEFPERRATATATIAINTSLSAAVNLSGGRLIAILMPAAWDAANLTFQGSPDGTTYGNVYDDGGNEVTVTAAVDRFIALETESACSMASMRYLKVRSGTSGSAVNQTAERSITLVLAP